MTTTYDCHTVANSTSALLLVDPVINRRLRRVLDNGGVDA